MTTRISNGQNKSRLLTQLLNTHVPSPHFCSKLRTIIRLCITTVKSKVPAVNGFKKNCAGVQCSGKICKIVFDFRLRMIVPEIPYL